MSAIFEAVFGAVLNVVTFFENLRVTRYDDPVTAEFKRRKSACVGSVAFMVLVLFLGAMTVAILGTLDTSPVLVAVGNGLREPLSYAFLLASGVGTLFACYSFYALWRFVKDGGGFDA